MYSLLMEQKTKEVYGLSSEVETFKGLCHACKHTKDCTYPGNNKHYVLQCAEFQGNEPMPSIGFGRDFPSLKPKVKEDVKQENFEYFQGLCTYCKNVEDCTLPRLEGGVWYCNEYLEI